MTPLSYPLASSGGGTLLVLLVIVAGLWLLFGRDHKARAARSKLSSKDKALLRRIKKSSADYEGSRSGLWDLFEEFKGNPKAFTGNAKKAHAAYKASKK